MSDTGRRGFSSNAREQIAPTSSKTTQERLSDDVDSNTDRAGRSDPSSNFDSDSQGVQDRGVQDRGVQDRSQRTSDQQGRSGASDNMSDKVKGTVGMNKN